MKILAKNIKVGMIVKSNNTNLQQEVRKIENFTDNSLIFTGVQGEFWYDEFEEVEVITKE